MWPSCGRAMRTQGMPHGAVKCSHGRSRSSQTVRIPRTTSTPSTLSTPRHANIAMPSLKLVLCPHTSTACWEACYVIFIFIKAPCLCLSHLALFSSFLRHVRFLLAVFSLIKAPLIQTTTHPPPSFHTGLSFFKAFSFARSHRICVEGTPTLCFRPSHLYSRHHLFIVEAIFSFVKPSSLPSHHLVFLPLWPPLLPSGAGRSKYV